MRLSSFSTFFVLLLTTGLSLTSLGSESWKLEKDKNGIKVYTKKSADSNLKDSKAVMTVKASVEEILSILIDFDKYTDWVPKCKVSYVIENEDGNATDEFYYYSEYSAPVVANRDMVIHAVVKRDNSTGIVIVDMLGVPDMMPEVGKNVRIPKFSGYWKLTPKENGYVEAINEYSTDPGGNVPDWLANTAAVDSPYDTFTNLKERLSSQ